MTTDPAQIRILAKQKDAENLAFRRYLRSRRLPDAPFRILADAVSKEVDCKACGNCCRQTLVTLTQAETAAIARYFEITPQQVIDLYTLGGPEPTLINEPDGCVFLDQGLCMIYEARPKACRSFPHLAIGGRSLTSRLSSICRRAELCPIVYNVLERYKKQLGFQT